MPKHFFILNTTWPVPTTDTSMMNIIMKDSIIQVRMEQANDFLKKVNESWIIAISSVDLTSKNLSRTKLYWVSKKKTADV